MLIADYEIFKKDTLLGVLDTDTKEVHQMWNVNDIRDYIRRHLGEIWVRLQFRKLR